MRKYKNHTLKEYSDQLSLRVPVPGGGSAAALAGSLGAALISMVANYSLGKKSKAIDGQIKKLLFKSEKIRKHLLELVDLDAQAYLQVVKTRHASAAVKKKALKKASDIPREVCRSCFSAVELTPFLVENGNRYLISDIEVAVELLNAAFNSALINVETNQ